MTTNPAISGVVPTSDLLIGNVKMVLPGLMLPNSMYLPAYVGNQISDFRSNDWNCYERSESAFLANTEYTY